MPLNGQQLEHYHLLRLVGSGGMGKVYLAEDTHIPRQVALKIVQTEPTLHSDEQEISDALRLFHREMEVIAKLDHSNILPLYDFGETRIGTNLITYMAMPYRPEGSLEDWLQRLEASHGLSFQDIAHIITQASEALQHAHEHNIVHQDVKPSNFLVRTKSGRTNEPDIFLVDFGVAKLMTATMITSQSVRGTPGYMAPEQWKGQALPATDQYALAIMAHYLLTGRTPFTGSLIEVMHEHLDTLPLPPSSYNANISATLDSAILRALAKRPEDRYAHITDFASAFEQAIRYQTVLNPFTLRGDAPQQTHESVQQPVAPTLNVPQPQQIFLSVPTKPDFNERNGVVAHTLQSTDTFMPPSDNRAQGNNGYIPYPSSPTAPSTPPSHRSRSLLVTLVLVTLAALVILASVSVLLYQQQVNRERTDAQETATAAAATQIAQIQTTEDANTATAQAQSTQFALNATTTAQAQSTANANATVQAQKTAQAIVNIGATATASVIISNPVPRYMTTSGAVQGTLTTYDTLGKKGQWDAQQDSNGDNCQFSNNSSYIVEQIANGFFYCTSLSMVKNFAFEVEMTIIQGNCGGVLFRVDHTNNRLLGYYFQICQNGDYKLLRLVDNVLTDATVLGEGNSTAFNSVNPVNTIAVVAEGGSITPYINGSAVSIYTQEDNTYSQGYLALAATATSITTQVEFSNARVWTLQ